MEDGLLNLFDQLPEDVIQMIFGAICDFKSLVQCMAVSQAFYRHAMSVSSLSIVCPVNFSTYEEKLNKIYSMVKEFRELQTLVVRVGHSRDEQASWACCMRYAEIGASVEKFMFMAAKSGDFSDLDNSLTCSKYNSEFQNGIFRGSAVKDTTKSKVEDQGNGGSLSASENSNGKKNIDRWGDTQSRDREFQYSTSNPGHGNFLQTPLHVRGFPRIGQLSEFSLRQVIAPSNDVMRRMLPVIHFAILQGLNEFRDVVPSFITNFPKLKRFLLVDLSESVTIHLRQHHLEEVRSLHLQDIADWEFNKSEEEFTVAENSANHEMPIFGKSTKTNHEIPEMQSLVSNFPNNGVTSSVYNQEQSKSDQNEGILKWKIDSSPKNELNCESNSVSLHAIGRRNESEELDLGETLSSETKLEKDLIKGKGLLGGPKITEKITCRKNFVHLKSENKKIDNGMGMIQASCVIHAEKDVRCCTKPDDAKLRYCHEDSERHFMQHERASELTYPKTTLPSCQYGVSHHDAEEPRGTSSLGVLDNVCTPISNSSRNRWINFGKTSQNVECPQKLTLFGKLTMFESDTGNARGRQDCHHSCYTEDDTWSTIETGGHLLSSEHTEGWNCPRDNFLEESTVDGSINRLPGEDMENKQEPYRCRTLRFHDVYRDGKMDIASRHPFKRGPKNDSLRFRDSGRNHKMGTYRTVDESSGNLENLRKAEILGGSSEANARKRQQFQTEDEFQCSPLISIPSSAESSKNSPENSGLTQEQHCAIFPESPLDERPMDSSFQLNSLAKDSIKTGSANFFSGKDYFENCEPGTSQHEKDITNSLSSQLNPQDNFLEEITCLEDDRNESSSKSSLHANHGAPTHDRSNERELWTETWRERVRRSRDARRNSRTLEDGRRDWEAHKMARNTFQRRKNDLEKEALSFDYSFWRAEQVVAENYDLSDVSMCIATYCAKPLGEEEIDILSYAALAGPLLAATVSHVNKQHRSHNL